MPDNPITESTRWVVVIRPSIFETIKGDKDFCSILALARVVNALYFVQQPLIGNENNDTPAGKRTRYNSFLFTCSLFAEATELIQGMHHAFGQNPEFQKAADVTKNKDAREILKRAWQVRKKLVFHFDIDEIQQQLSTLELKNPIFVSCLGQTKVNTYNELADIVALRVLFGLEFPNEISTALIMTKKLTDLVLAFLTAAEDFMVSALMERNWTEPRIAKD